MDDDLFAVEILYPKGIVFPVPCTTHMRVLLVQYWNIVVPLELIVC